MKTIKCRACSEPLGAPVVSLGVQASSGVFVTKEEQEDILRAPLELVRCEYCELVQLSHSMPPETMFGEGYGYRSSLNSSMVKHLKEQANRASALYTGSKKGVFLDIGSNDGTLLNNVQASKFLRYGIDPACDAMADGYEESIVTSSTFFSAESFLSLSNRKADVVTSFAMFYDLESPVNFAKEVAGILSEGGTWVLEQSYLPKMLKNFAFDTICHEHLNYFSLRSIRYILGEARLRIAKVMFNDINGGSFRLEVKHAMSATEDPLVAGLMQLRAESQLSNHESWIDWGQELEARCSDLRGFLEFCRTESLQVAGIGASTKGNVLLQAAGINSDLLPVIGEVNQDKVGLVTPGSQIPIVSESEALKIGTDFLVILPWHFRQNLIERFEAQINSGARLVFPLPNLEIVG